MTVQYRNPYTNRRMIREPEDFYGRTREIRQAFDFISKMQSLSIVGDRRIGKSSLLYALQQPSIQSRFGFDSSEYLFGYMDFSRFTRRQPEDLLTELASLAVKQLESRWKWQPDQTMTLAGFEDLIEEIGAAGFKLVYLIDEFDSILQADAFDAKFLAYLRSLSNGSDLAWVIASTARLGEISSVPVMSSPFFNIFGIISLGPLRYEEAIELIVGPSHERGTSLEQHAEFLLELAGLHPLLLQSACYGLFEALVGLHLQASEAYKYAHSWFVQETLDHFKYAWSHLSLAERRIHTLACADTDGSSTADAHYLLISSGYREFVNRHRAGTAEIVNVGSVRSALQHLDNPDYLADSPLARLSIVTSQVSSLVATPSSLESAQAVKWLLEKAILSLRPDRTLADRKVQRHFQILSQVYLKGNTPRRVWMGLGLGERTYYRDMKLALEKLVAVIRYMEAQSISEWSSDQL